MTSKSATTNHAATATNEHRREAQLSTNTQSAPTTIVVRGVTC